MKQFTLLLFVLLPAVLYANDGGIAIIGDSFHPIHIANVSMDYERLTITCKRRGFEVEVYIELFNHEKTVMEPQLGFEFLEGWNVSYDMISRSKEYILGLVTIFV